MYLLQVTLFRRHPSAILIDILDVLIYKKSWPVLYSELLYKIGQDFLDIQYIHVRRGVDSLTSVAKLSLVSNQ